MEELLLRCLKGAGNEEDLLCFFFNWKVYSLLRMKW